MKPIVIYPKTDGDKIALNKKDFEEYLRQAYDAGYADGYAAGRSMNWWTTPITYPNTNPITWTNEPKDVPNPYWTTEPNDVPNPYKITCDAHNDM